MLPSALVSNQELELSNKMNTGYRRDGRQVRPVSRLKKILEKAGFLALALALFGGLAVTVPAAFAEAPPLAEASPVAFAAAVEGEAFVGYLADDGGAYEGGANDGLASYGHSDDNQPGDGNDIDRYGDNSRADSDGDDDYQPNDTDAPGADGSLGDGALDQNSGAEPGPTGDEEPAESEGSHEYDAHAPPAGDDSLVTDSEGSGDVDSPASGDHPASTYDPTSTGQPADTDYQTVSEAAAATRVLPPVQRFNVDIAAAWDGPIGHNTGGVTATNPPDGWNPNRAVSAGTNVPGMLSVTLNDIELGTPGQLHVDLVFATVNGGPAWLPSECGGGQNSRIEIAGANSRLYCRLVNMTAATARNIPFVMVTAGGDTPTVMSTTIYTVSGSEFDGHAPGESELDFGANIRTVSLPDIHVADAPAAINLTLAPAMATAGRADQRFTFAAMFAISQPLGTALLADSLSFDLLLDTPINRDTITWEPSSDRLPWYQVVELVSDPRPGGEPVAEEGWFLQNAIGWRHLPGVPQQRSRFEFSATRLDDNAGYRVHLRGFNSYADLNRSTHGGGHVSGDYRWVLNGLLPFMRQADVNLDSAWQLGVTIGNVEARTADGRLISEETIPLTVTPHDNDAFGHVTVGGGGFNTAWSRGWLFYMTQTNASSDATAQLVGWDRYLEPNSVRGQANSPHREQATQGWGSNFDGSPRVGGGAGAVQFASLNTNNQDAIMCLQASPQAPFNGMVSVHAENDRAPVGQANIIVEVHQGRSPMDALECGQPGDAGWQAVPMVTLNWGGGDDEGMRLAADLNQMPSLVGFAGRLRLRVNPASPIPLNTNLHVGRRINPTVHNQDIWAIGAISHDNGAVWTTPVRDGGNSIVSVPGSQHGIGWYTGNGQDVLFGTPWLPELTLAASVTNPMAAQLVTFTSRAIPLATAATGMQNVVLELNVDIPAGLTLDRDSIVLRSGGVDGPVLNVVPTFQERDCHQNASASCVGITIAGEQIDIPLNTPVFLTFQARADWELGARVVAAWVTAPALADLGLEWAPSVHNRGEARVNLNRTIGGTVAFEKVVDDDEAALDSPNAWELRVRNNTGTPMSSDVIDILPFVGDGRGTQFTGDFAITSLVPASDTTVLTTTVDPRTIHPDPRHPSNSLTGGASIWTVRADGFQANVPAAQQRQITGIRFIATADLAPGGLAAHRIYWHPIGSEPEDTFVNYAWALTGGVDLRLVRADDSVTVEQPTELQVHIAPGVVRGEYVYWLVYGRNSGDNVALDVKINTSFSAGGFDPEWSNIGSGTAYADVWVLGRVAPNQVFTATLRARVESTRLEQFETGLAIGELLPGLQATVIISSPNNAADQITYQQNASVYADTDQWDLDTVLFPSPKIEVVKNIGGQSLVGVPVYTPQVVTFVMTNAGDEPLTNLTFADETVVGVPVTDIVFDDLVITDAGYLADADSGSLITLAPGASITAHGVLPGMSAGERHENIVTVTGVGVISGASVTDDDDLVVETVSVHIAKDILEPVGGQTVNGVVYLDVDPTTGLTREQVVTFTVTNRSSEGLRRLVFEDRILSGQPISEITFDPAIVQAVVAEGEVVRVVFQPDFVLEVGAQLTGTGVLAPMAVGERHHNAASIWGEGAITEQPTEDGTDQPRFPGADGPDNPDGSLPPVPDNELIADTVGIRLEKFIAGAPVNDAGHPILQADRATGTIPAQQITFRITNVGSEALTRLSFTDVTLALPSLSAVSFPTVPGAVIMPEGDDWRVEFGAFVLNPGAVLYGVGQLPALHGSDLKHHNLATVSGQGVGSGRRVTDVDELLIDPVDLEIAKSVASNDGSYRAGSEVTWTVTVTNHGPDRAVNVDITDRLDNPNQATITGARLSQIPAARSSRLSYSQAGVDAWLEYLDAGESTVITISGVLSATLVADDVVINTARVASDTPNYGTYPDYATARLVVRGAPAPTPAAPVPPGVLTQTGANLLLGLLALVVIVGGAGLLISKRRKAAA